MFPVSIFYKSIAGRYRPVMVAVGPITARYRFKNKASWVYEMSLLAGWSEFYYSYLSTPSWIVSYRMTTFIFSKRPFFPHDTGQICFEYVCSKWFSWDYEATILIKTRPLSLCLDKPSLEQIPEGDHAYVL